LSFAFSSIHFVKDCPLNKPEAFGAFAPHNPIVETHHVPAPYTKQFDDC
jgi:hypothetical protein